MTTLYAGVIYNASSGDYVDANGLSVLRGLDTLGPQIAANNPSKVTVRFEQNGRTNEYTFNRPSSSSNSIDYSSEFARIKNYSTAIVDSYFSLVTTGPAAEAALALNNFKTQILFEGTKGVFGVSLDVTNGLIQGESPDKALGSAGINFAANILYGLEAATVAGFVLATGPVTGTLIFAAAVAGFLTAVVLNEQVNQAVNFGTGGLYTEVGDYLYDEIANTVKAAGEPDNSFLKLGGKNLSEINTWRDTNNKIQIKGTDFTSEIDPKTGILTFKTGVEATRQSFKDTATMEKLIQSVKQYHGGNIPSPSKVVLQNTTDPTKTSTYIRIPKEIENQLKTLTKNATTLDSLTPLKQTDTAKYYTPTQIAPLKLKTNEYNQAKKDQVQAGISAAKANGTLANLNKQHGIEDQAPKIIKAKVLPLNIVCKA